MEIERKQYSSALLNFKEVVDSLRVPTLLTMVPTNEDPNNQYRWRTYYGLAKYTNGGGANGIEFGVMIQPMADFCGGLLVRAPVIHHFHPSAEAMSINTLLGQGHITREIAEAFAWESLCRTVINVSVSTSRRVLIAGGATRQNSRLYSLFSQLTLPRPYVFPSPAGTVDMKTVTTRTKPLLTMWDYDSRFAFHRMVGVNAEICDARASNWNTGSEIGSYTAVLHRGTPSTLDLLDPITRDRTAVITNELSKQFSVGYLQKLPRATWHYQAV